MARSAMNNAPIPKNNLVMLGAMVRKTGVNLKGRNKAGPRPCCILIGRDNTRANKWYVRAPHLDELEAAWCYAPCKMRNAAQPAILPPICTLGHGSAEGVTRVLWALLVTSHATCILQELKVCNAENIVNVNTNLHMC